MAARIDLIGARFARLVVKRYAGADKHNRATWECLCDCGATIVAAGANLRHGYVKSCGCLWAEKNTGVTLDEVGNQTRLYQIWNGMKQRCRNPHHVSYPDYGGRGIRVCEEWIEFRPFHDWAMVNGYRDDLTIDRIKSNEGYHPGNCRWATREVQGNNTIRNRQIEFRGETKTLANWAKAMGVKYSTLCRRLAQGWSVERALTEPVETKFDSKEAV